MSSDSEDDIPLSKRLADKIKREIDVDSEASSPPASQIRSASRIPDDSDDDIPLAMRKVTKQGGSKLATEMNGGTNGLDKRKKQEASSDSDSDVPLAKKIRPVKSSAVAVKKENDASARNEANNSQSETKKRKRSTNNTSKPSTKSKENAADGVAKKVKKEESKGESETEKSKTKKTKKEVEEEEEEAYRWWEEQNEENDGSIKWTTFEHNGVLFPPEYEPHGVKMKYDGVPVELEPEAEEVATYFAQVLNTDHYEKKEFRENFFRDFLAVLAKCKNPPPIKEFDKCDFTPIYDHLERLKEEKKAMSKDEKKRLKEEKLKMEEKYMYALVDGRKEKVGNFRIEPPGLFRGRGAHPKTGTLKTRVQPEQVTINIGKDAPIPKPPEGHKWGKIVHDQTVTWLAMWKENVNDSFKYVFLAAGSSWKGQSDFKKFEKARELKKHVARIRRDYLAELKDKLMETRQRATAMWLIDHLALRAGNEKGDDEADTVGCCSLRCEHVSLEPPNIVHLSFLGKDSIKYENTVPVDEQVFKNLKIFKKDKDDEDPIFDRLNTAKLNKHLNSLMPGLTAKVFRTYNASYVFQQQLENTPAEGSVAEKLLAYNRANQEVAVLCNHQRSISKGHHQQMSKIRDKIRALKYQRLKLKQTMLTIDPKLKKARPDLTEPESDLEEDWVVEHEKTLLEKEREKIQAKFEKENEALVAEGKEAKPAKELQARLKEVDEREKELAKERETGKVEPKRNQTIEKLDAAIKKVNERISNTHFQMRTKDETKQVALSTSKINYIDPRISAAWCYKHKVPLDKVFNRSLREKFKWAMEVDEEWRF
ncbi:uncharacterized protein VTP21DRAFT_5726 [Calcarisporiella thermophila]|uniref:uncharacterized protein n=1 Tax=Calcarisporiella thermophila TaxID=911321 RepID=UPI0037423D78